jgi:hypothetical protein
LIETSNPIEPPGNEQTRHKQAAGSILFPSAMKGCKMPHQHFKTSESLYSPISYGGGGDSGGSSGGGSISGPAQAQESNNQSGLSGTFTAGSGLPPAPSSQTIGNVAGVAALAVPGAGVAANAGRAATVVGLAANNGLIGR